MTLDVSMHDNETGIQQEISATVQDRTATNQHGDEDIWDDQQIVDARDHGLLIWAEPCLLLDLFPLFNLCSTCCSLNIFNSQGEQWAWELRYPYLILEHLGLNPGSNFLLIRAPEGSSDGSRNEAPGLIWKMFELLTLFFSLANPQSHSHLGEELRHPYQYK